MTIHILLGAALLSLLPLASSAATLPTLPQQYIDTTYSAPTGATCTAANSSAFQTCLKNAALNSTIVLNAGTTYTGPFTLPNKTSGSGWIYIISSNLASLPGAGTRVGPSNAANMPKIVTSQAGVPAITAASNAHHYRFVGVEFSSTSGVSMTNTVISVGNSDNWETSTSLLPNNITFDRCYIHGDATVGGRRGIAMNGISIAVIDSYISDFKQNGYDTQALWAHNSPGPLKIVNNYLEASGENVMFGGAVPAITNLVPSDIEIRRNYVYKPLAWMSQSWTIKNLFEVKNGQRILIEGNIFENIWAQAQSGWAFQFVPKVEDGRVPWAVAQDITFKLNKLINVGNGINLSGYENYGSVYTPIGHRFLFENNLILVTGLGGNTVRGIFQILNGPHDITWRHNTSLHSPTTSGSFVNVSNGSTPTDQFDYRDNLTTFGAYGFRDDYGVGSNVLNRVFTNWTMTNNAIIGPNSSSTYPSGNFWPSNTNAVGFVDYAGGNYRLTSASPYHNAGTDGKDLGADIDAIEAAISGSSGGGGGGTILTAPTNLNIQ